MHSLTYHSGFSLNVTSLGKPLTSETRLGPRGRLSEALHNFPFHTELFGLNTCLLSFSPTSAKAGVTVIFLTPLPWSLMHGDCSVHPRRYATCGPHREKLAKSQPSELRASLAKSNQPTHERQNTGILKARRPLHLMQHAIRKEQREGISRREKL